MKPLLIGCGLVIVLIIGVIGAAFIFLPDLIKKGMDFANEAIAAEQERQGLAVNWIAPAADADPAKIFPAQLDAYQRTTAEKSSGIPQLSITLPGAHAVYESGPGRIDAYVFPVTQSQRTDLLQQIEKLKQGQSSSTWMNIDLGPEYARAYLSSNALEKNQLWFTKTHLVVFRTTDEDDREPILKAFFKAAQQPAASAPTGTNSPDPKKIDGKDIEPEPSDADKDDAEENAPRKKVSANGRGIGREPRRLLLAA